MLAVCNFIDDQQNQLAVVAAGLLPVMAKILGSDKVYMQAITADIFGNVCSCLSLNMSALQQGFCLRSQSYSSRQMDLHTGKL